MTTRTAAQIVERFQQLAAPYAYMQDSAAAVMADYYASRTVPCAVDVGTQTTSSTHRLPCHSFFTGKTTTGRSYGRSETIEDLLRMGEGPSWTPQELEHRHDYIQYLFPLRVMGVNAAAPLLTSRDVVRMRADPHVMSRVLRGFSVMCRFYGMEVRYRWICKESGEVAATITRSSNVDEQQRQYANLCRHSHNYLRISRILQFLGEMELEPLKIGWLRFLAHDIFTTTTATKKRRRGDDGASTSPCPPLAPCMESFGTFWIETPYSIADRLALKAEVLQQMEEEPATKKPPLVEVECLCVPINTQLPPPAAEMVRGLSTHRNVCDLTMD